MRNIHITLLLTLALLPAFAVPPGGADANARAQAWLDSLKEDELVAHLKTLALARQGPVDAEGAMDYLNTLLTSVDDVHPNALAYPGSMVALSLHGVILPSLRAFGYGNCQELKQALAERGMVEPKASLPPPASPVPPPTPGPDAPPSAEPAAAIPAAPPAAAPAAPSGTASTRTLAAEDLTFHEALTLIHALNPRLPDGTYDEPALSSCLMIVGRHHPGLAASLTGHYRAEQGRLRAALAR